MKRVVMMSLALLFSAPAAAIYKCVDAEGNVGFSEVPCAAEEQSSTVNVGSSGPKMEERVCELVTLYAEDVFKRMRKHGDSTRELDRYGGVYGAGSAIVGVVNYVYGFRLDENASARRVAGLARSKCENGGFGRIRFEELPRDDYYVFDEYQQAWVRKGEGGGYRDRGARPQSPMPSPPRALPTPSAPDDAAYRRRQCEHYQAEIDKLDDRMRGGYSAEQGEIMRDQRRAMRGQMRVVCR